MVPVQGDIRATVNSIEYQHQRQSIEVLACTWDAGFNQCVVLAVTKEFKTITVYSQGNGISHFLNTLFWEMQKNDSYNGNEATHLNWYFTQIRNGICQISNRSSKKRKGLEVWVCSIDTDFISFLITESSPI